MTTAKGQSFMEDEETSTQSILHGALLLHEALLVALYVDRIRFDKELRRVIQSGEQSLAIFSKDVGLYIDNYPTTDAIRLDARSRVAGFFQEVDEAWKRASNGMSD